MFINGVRITMAIRNTAAQHHYRTPSVTMHDVTAQIPEISSLRATASPDEAAAIVAALETFMRATAPAGAPQAAPVDLWQRAAILEGVEREPDADIQHPWINT